MSLNLRPMKRKGFTLIELLVVIAIIGLLSTLAVVALNSARQRSRDAKRVADIRQIQTALELGFSETSAYPVQTSAVPLGSATGTLVLCKNASGVSAWQNSATVPTTCGTIYMGLVPSNPTPGGSNYTYASADGSSYSLTFTLEGATGKLQAGINCANADDIKAGPSC
jgi:prepilin-type N-terminal cleavage/methylation domain-containing protein